MGKKIFLHIGFFKAGSTSIQVGLKHNAAFLERNGFLYPFRPGAAYVQNGQHTPLRAALTNAHHPSIVPSKRATIEFAVPDLLADIAASPAHNVILSCEAWSNPNTTADQVRLLRDTFASHDVTAIAYVRRQDATLLSAYQQGIKSGSTEPFDFDRLKTQPRLFLTRSLAPWREGLGHDQVIVRPFVPDLWVGKDLLLDFLTEIGAPTDGIQNASEVKNESLDYRIVELRRRLNLRIETAFPDMPAQKKQNLWKTLRQNFREVQSSLDSIRKMKLSAEKSNHLRDIFREENIGALVGTNVDVDTFFPETTEDQVEIIAPESFDEDMLLTLAAQLAQSAAKKTEKLKNGRNNP